MMTPLLIAGGPNEADFAWTQRFMESMTSVRADMPYGFSVHDYFHRSDALNFTSTGWYSLLAQPRHFVDMLERHGQLVRVGTRKPMTLVVDEWGPWYHGQTGSTDPAHLFEQVPTLRDALVTAMMFDAFHSHADIVGMTTVAQTVNCIHSLFLTQGEHYVRTPVYHAFALYQPHIGGTAVRTIAAADRITFTSDAPNEGASWIAGVSASATRHDASGAQGKHIVLTVTNPHLDRALSTTVVVRGATVRSGDVTQLTHTDPHAHNTFDAPEVVRLGATAPLALPTSSASDTFTLTLPPASVTRVVCMLGV
jgi:alpha-N-arabinofuranosidase